MSTAAHTTLAAAPLSHDPVERERSLQKKRVQDMKKEKEAKEREREILRRGIEEDKAERAAKLGKPVPVSVLATAPAALRPLAALSPDAQLGLALDTVLKSRREDALPALQLVASIVQRIVDSSADPKYRSVNTSAAAFKAKVLHVYGWQALRGARGFSRAAEG